MGERPPPQHPSLSARIRPTRRAGQPPTAPPAHLDHPRSTAGQPSTEPPAHSATGQPPVNLRLGSCPLGPPQTNNSAHAASCREAGCGVHPALCCRHLTSPSHHHRASWCVKAGAGYNGQVTSLESDRSKASRLHNSGDMTRGAEGLLGSGVRGMRGYQRLEGVPMT